MSREVERRETLEFVKNEDKIGAEIVFNALYEHWKRETGIATFSREIKKLSVLHSLLLFRVSHYFNSSESLLFVLGLTADQYRAFVYTGQTDSGVCGLMPVTL